MLLRLLSPRGLNVVHICMHNVTYVYVCLSVCIRRGGTGKTMTQLPQDSRAISKGAINGRLEQLIHSFVNSPSSCLLVHFDSFGRKEQSYLLTARAFSRPLP